MSDQLRVPRGEDQRTLDLLLGEVGMSAEEAERLRNDGNLGLAIVDRMLFPDPALYTARQLGELAGMGDDVHRWIRAFGLPDSEPDEPVFNDADVEIYRFVHDLVAAHLSHEERVLSTNRVIGTAMARLATAIVDGFHDRALTLDSDDDAATAKFAIETGQLTAEALPVILEYVWIKHLRVAMRRRLSLPGFAAGTMAVGFADLVGFTSLVQQITETELAAMLGRFEAVVFDVVMAYGGRVVKTIGDEAMFAFDDPAAAVEVGLKLAEIHHFDEALPELRVGIGYGPVLAREGDLFGPMVNKASRIVPLAHPGSVLVSTEVGRAVAGSEHISLSPLRQRRYLKGIGSERLLVARWADKSQTNGWRRRAG